MAKKITVDLSSLRRADTYAKQIKKIYDEFIKECAKLAISIDDYDPDKPFQWKKYPQTKARIDKLIKDLHKKIKLVIEEAVKREWSEAEKANDKMVKDYLRNEELLKHIEEQNAKRNQEAVNAFLNRKTNGMNLSGRVWNLSEGAKREIEMALDAGLSEGKSAAELSRDIRKLLNEPERLYRRIRNKETGAFYLSKNAKLYNPGRGMYRSSYKNAMRLTRTETNMAYRMSDMNRWSNLEFVVGYEVKRSNNVFKCPMCEQLKGKYPKTFVFTGWHPQCRCYVTSILASREEFIEYQKKKLNGEEAVLKSKNEVRDMPDGFKQWMNDNSDKLKGNDKVPYFVRDNYSEEQINNGDWRFERGNTEPDNPTNPIDTTSTDNGGTETQAEENNGGNAVTDSKGRTLDYIDSIKQRWAERNAKHVYKLYQGEITDAVSLSKAMEEISRNKGWFEHGYQGVFELDVRRHPNANANTLMRGDINLRKNILDNVVSGINHLNRGFSISNAEAKAIATYWHELTHNRNKVGNVGLTKTQTFYMETANELVARKTLPEFYGTFGSEVQHPEFMKNRDNTAYNRRVRNYTKIINKTGLDFDIVVDKVKGTLFNESYKYQLKGLKDALKGAKKADGTRLKATDVNTLMKYLNGGEQDYEALINMVIRSANTN